MMTLSAEARLTKSGHLKANGVNINALHETAMKHHDRVAQYHYLKDTEDSFSVSESLGYAQWLVDTEYFLIGFLNGLSFEGWDVCSDGLQSAVIAGFDVLEYLEVYIPENITKFTIATIQLQEAINLIYVYCNFTHMAEVFAELFSGTNFQQYGELISRILGSLILQLWVIIDQIEQGVADDDYEAVGYASGEILTIFIDTLI